MQMQLGEPPQGQPTQGQPPQYQQGGAQTQDAPSFERALGRLEEIVRALESGREPLDGSLSLFEEGTSLVRLCTRRLDEAEQKITMLTRGADGKDDFTEFRTTAP